MTKPRGKVIERYQRKHAKAPEHKSVRQPGQGPLRDHQSLRAHFPKHLADARSDGAQAEIGITLRRQDDAQRRPKLPREQKTETKMAISRTTRPGQFI